MEETTGTDEKYTVEQLFKNFSKEKNTVHLKFSMSIVRAFVDTKGVSGVEIFSFDVCDTKLKENFNEAIKKLKDSTYETLIATNKNGEYTKVLLKIRKDFIREIVVITGGNSPAMVRIKGKIKHEDVKDVIEKTN
jgi:phosphoglycolate phosphatase-like HAD superfamily hydrolase